MRSMRASTSSSPLNAPVSTTATLDEDDALEVAREHPEAGEERVAAEPAVAADEEDRDRLLLVDLAEAGHRCGARRARRQVLGPRQLRSSRRMARTTSP